MGQGPSGMVTLELDSAMKSHLEDAREEGTNMKMIELQSD